LPKKYHLEDVPNVNLSGLCECGCGQKTELWRYGSRKNKGYLRGYPVHYATGHSGRFVGRPKYEIQNRGYKTPCWVWLGSVNCMDYGYVDRKGKHIPAHRVFYEEKHGPIPEGKQLDHLCRVHRCVNPDHLEPVTNAENTRRGARAKITMEDAREIRRMKKIGLQSCCDESIIFAFSCDY
jgi:HNH endonuclease